MALELFQKHLTLTAALTDTSTFPVKEGTGLTACTYQRAKTALLMAPFFCAFAVVRLSWAAIAGGFGLLVCVGSQSVNPLFAAHPAYSISLREAVWTADQGEHSETHQ